jgi:hypothetical protein
MKTTIAIALSILIFTVAYSQNYRYQDGPVKLVVDESFLPEADWDKLFYDWEQTSMDRKTGLHKDFVIAPDGRVIISNRSNYSVYILDKSGRLLKTFGKKGGKPGEFLYRQNFHGILDNLYLVFSDHQGRINFFDLDGNFVKMITIDFMPLDIYPGRDGKIIIMGHVPMKTYTRKVLAALDYTSEKYDIFYSFNESYDRTGQIEIKTDTGQRYLISTNHGVKWITTITPSGELISARNNDMEVKVFSPYQGSFKESSFNIDAEEIPITQEDKDTYYRNFKENLKKRNMDTTYAEKIKRDGYFPEHMPYYYNILADEKNNCLFFVYNNDNKDHLFRAYSLTGEYLGESEFIIEGYEVMFQTNPVFMSDGVVYATALKEGAKNPLRIIKCRMVSN